MADCSIARRALVEWGICTTAKAPLQELLAFIAWHKHIGASHFWIHLDDAAKDKAEVLNGLDGVTAILCDDAYWAQKKSGRPAAHQARQSHNMQRVYKLTDIPFLAHIDVDEYLYSDRDMADIISEWDDGSATLLRAAPAEALHDPTLPDDIFTGRQFRRPFPKRTPIEQRVKVLGDYELIMPYNILSHRVGKALFRTGIKGMNARIHGGSKDKERLRAKVHPDLTVLHFHSQNKEEWISNLLRRATKGAYRKNAPLVALAKHATEQEIDAFYTYTQTATPRLIDALQNQELLIEADLKLKEKVAALL